MEKLLAGYAPQAYANMRIVVGLLFFCHGLQKVFGWFGVMASFVAGGQMAAAYFLGHFPNGFWPIQNGGEASVFYCFVFLYMATRGASIWTIDGPSIRTE